MTDTSPKIFICYAHKDNKNDDSSKQWLNRLLEQLAPLELQEQADIWSDQEIELGEEWHDKIQKTLQQVKAAVLLVSPSFLSSKYIRNSELPVLLKNAKDKGVIILPILLRQCLWRETKFRFPDPKKGPEELSLSSIQVPSSQPLNGMDEDKQDEVLYKVAHRIYQIVNTESIKSDTAKEDHKQISQEQPKTTTVVNNNLTRLEKITILRDNLLMCSSMKNPSQRKQIISNLNSEIANKVEQEGDANSVVLSLVTTCLQFSGGLLNLLKTTEILHEKGTIQMNKLWQSAQELFPEEMS